MLTGGKKSTVRQLNPEDDWERYTVPPLVSLELWERACKVVAERGRGRGKKGQTISALLRGRIICPSCDKPMVVRRAGRDRRIYYHCSRYFKHWVDEPCGYRGFIPGTWDEFVWEDICCILRDGALVFEQLASEQEQEENTEKLIRLQRFKITRAKSGIARVQEGFEGELYDLNQAKEKISRYHLAIADAEQAIKQLQVVSQIPQQVDQEALLEELKAALLGGSRSKERKPWLDAVLQRFRVGSGREDEGHPRAGHPDRERLPSPRS